MPEKFLKPPLSIREQMQNEVPVNDENFSYFTCIAEEKALSWCGNERTTDMTDQQTLEQLVKDVDDLEIQCPKCGSNEILDIEAEEVILYATGELCFCEDCRHEFAATGETWGLKTKRFERGTQEAGANQTTFNS